MSQDGLDEVGNIGQQALPEDHQNINGRINMGFVQDNKIPSTNATYLKHDTLG